MKFDFVIGNPPYQENTIGDNKNYAPPVYHQFLDSAYEIADVVEMIHPARFLFNAGSTPKAWNKKMLNDEHVKVIFYEPKSDDIFPNTEIKGGVAVTYRDKKTFFGATGTFTPYQELNKILGKVTNADFQPLSNIMYAPEIYKLTDKLHSDYPNARNSLSKGHDYDLKSNIFEKLSDIFLANRPNDGGKYIRIFGRHNNERVYRWIKAEYITEPDNLYKYKVFIAKANGSGRFGETMSEPVVAEPGVGNNQSFLSIGAVDNEYEAKAISKYVKTKFSRALLGVLKITQDNTKDKWVKVPLQDFSTKSDIDWNKTISDIDHQLYNKYGLSKEEIDFIETNVKEMD